MSQWFSKSITKRTAAEEEKVSGATVASWRQVATAAAASLANTGGRSMNMGGFKLEKQWQEKILSHGSARDRILLKYKLIVSSPAAHVKHLDSLIPMVTPAKKRDCATAIDVLRKLFMQLLPKSRTLIPFEQRPFRMLDVVDEGGGRSRKQQQQQRRSAGEKAARRDRALTVWLFEDTLRRRYEDFLTNLENVVLRDVLETNKKKALGAMFELLQSKPEQRSKLVRVLANKVGDPSGKLASHAKHKLLLAAHKKNSLVPAFVAEFEQMLYRANIREKAQYFVICCLNSMQLKRKAGKAYDQVPLMLIKIYCSFFRAALDKSKVVKRKMLSALLSGIHRAFPFLKQEEVAEHLQKHINDLFRLVHTAHTFSQSVQTLMVLFHFSQHHEEVRDRFYQVLYRKIGDWRQIRKSSQRQSLLLHLLFRALSEDDDLPRLTAFAKRLLQLCLTSADVPLVCGVLLVLSELQKLHPGMINTRQFSAKVTAPGLEDEEEEYFPDIDSDVEEEEQRKGRTGKPPASGPNPSKPTGYDPSARNPRYCGAERECSWELLQLGNNFYHPSVRVFATAILTGRPIDYSGDPFEDFTRIHFLDRFLQKKPRRAVQTGSDAAARARSLPVNSDEYRQLAEHEVPPDERCFHEFARVQKERRRRKAGKEEEEEEDDGGSVGDEEFDAYLEAHEEDIDADLKDLDDLDDDEEDEVKDLSDEEMAFSLSDDDEEAWDPSSGSEAASDDDGEDGGQMMDVDEEEEDDDDDGGDFAPAEDNGINSFAFAGREESSGDRKQRRWEERRSWWTERGRSGRRGGRRDFPNRGDRQQTGRGGRGERRGRDGGRGGGHPRGRGGRGNFRRGRSFSRAGRR